MSKEVVAEVIALIELGMIAPEDIVKCLRKANSEPEKALAEQPAQDVPETNFGNMALDKMAENARELGLDYEPAQRTWVYLTDEEIRILAGSLGYGPYVMEVVRAAEAKLKEKNNG